MKVDFGLWGCSTAHRPAFAGRQAQTEAVALLLKKRDNMRHNSEALHQWSGINDHEVVEPLNNPRCNRGQWEIGQMIGATLKGLNLGGRMSRRDGQAMSGDPMKIE